MSQLPVWGIDVSASSLRAVLLAETPEGKIRVDAWDVVDYAEDVEDVRSVGRYDAMLRAVKRFLQHQNVRSAKVVASIRGETAFMRTVSTPQLADESLDKILAYEARQQVPYPLEEVYWDRRVVSIQEKGDVTFSLYAIRRQEVDDRLRKLGHMGLPVDALQLRPLATQNFCAAERLLSDGAVVVDFDYSGTQLLLAHDDRTWFRCLPTGGCDHVARIRSKLITDHASAVRLATGELKPRPAQAGMLAEATRSAAREVAEEVAGLVRYYGTLHPGAAFDRVVLLTAHRACPPLAKALADATGLPVSEPRGFKTFEFASDVVAAGLQENFAGLARAAGLALQGLGKADTAVRLYPETIPRTFSRGKAGYLAAATFVLGAVVAGWLRDERLTDDLGAATAALRGRLDAARPFVKERVEKEKIVDDPLPPLIERSAARARGRLGAAPFLSEVLKTLARPFGKERAEPGAPRLVAFEAGSAPDRVARPGAGRLVLAEVEHAAPDVVDRDLDALAASLVGKAGLVAAKPLESWSSGAPLADKPAQPDERLLRVRFRHRAYELTFEDVK